MDLDIRFTDSKNWDASMLERLEWMRDNVPVHWSPADEMWIVTKYRDVEAISKNQDLFTSAEGVRPDRRIKIGLIDEPKERHTKLRRLINRGFTPRMVSKLEEAFMRITTQSIDAVAAKGECDFVEDIAVPLPLLLIAEMIGIRPEDHDRFHHWSDAMIGADGHQDEPEVMMAAGRAFAEYSAYVTEIIEDRRTNPRDDLVSILTGAKDDGTLTLFDRKAMPGVEVEEDGGNLANDELLLMLVILLVAGNETTRNGISGGMQLLIENPGERQKLLENPELIPSAVEEMVRMVAPVRSFSRTVTRDTEVRGKPMKAGQRLLMVYTAANRDPEIYDDPGVFRIERNPQHLGFGIGSHFCLGANLARMEMRVAFRELLRRLPDMEYADGGPEFSPSALVRTCTRMQVRFTPERCAA